MNFESVDAFTRRSPELAPGILGIVFCDPRENTAATLEHLERLGIATAIVIGDPGVAIDATIPVVEIAEQPTTAGVPAMLNMLIDMLDDCWLLWQWAGEFFLFPYFETRRLADFTTFLTDERRRMAYTYTLDAYAEDLPGAEEDPRDSALCFDRIGYYGFIRGEQQLSVYGGPGWRFDECCTPRLKQLGRTALLRAKSGIYMGRDGQFEAPEFSSVSCPWHNNPTAAMISLRHTRSIMAHPAFPPLASSLVWAGSETLEWTSGQLLDLGLIEPGQWF